VTVQYPVVKPSTMSTYMVYPLTVQYDDQEKKFGRRYSDFFSLREALKSLLPYNFIFPVHKKQAIVRLQEQ
jgi:hypothetical protein